jgi:hypothetical protein
LNDDRPLSGKVWWRECDIYTSINLSSFMAISNR